MKQKIKNNWKILILLTISILVIVIIAFSQIKNDNNRTFISYKEFNQKVLNNEIDTVTINEKELEFKIKNDNQTNYYTDNPNTTTLKQNLLLQDIEVLDNASSNIIYTILDVLLYAVFFAIIVTLVIKYKQTMGDNFKIIKQTKVKFDDIVGMDELKKEMLKTVDVLKNPIKYTAQGIRPTKGIILEGPPGNGKTLFAKALANEAKVNFIATKGADFQSAMMSMGSKKIKTLFKKAKKHKPCIIFIDEFDGIGERRNYAGTGVDKENNRIIIAMLNEMDGFDTEDGILVIAATNSYNSLDAALIRPGRFDLKFNIPNPDLNTRIKLINLYLKNKQIENTVNIQTLAECLDNSCSATIETLLNEANMTSKLSGRDKIAIEDIIIASKKMNMYLNIKKLTK